MKSKNLKFLVFTLILGVYAAFLLHKDTFPTNDLGIRLKIGEIVWQTKSVFQTNYFSYTEPDQQFINRYWLHGLIFYSLHSAFGFEGLVIFNTLLLLAAFSILFLSAARSSNFWLCAVISLPAILILQQRTDIRPETFTYFFIAVFYYLLVSAGERPEKNRIFWLIPLQALWVNLHLFYPIGILLAAGFLLEKLVRGAVNPENPGNDLLVKKLFLLVPLLLAASCCSPNGLGGVFAVTDILKKSSVYAVGENHSILQYLRTNPENIAAIRTFLLMILCFILVVIRELLIKSRQKSSFSQTLGNMPVFFYLAGAGAAAAGIMSVRGIALFAMTLLPALSAGLNVSAIQFSRRPEKRFQVKERITGAVCVSALAALFLFFIYSGIAAVKRPDFGIGLSPGSGNATNFFKENKLKGPLFNDYNIGSYLVYKLFPETKVFVDTRGGDAYSQSFFNNIYTPMLQSEQVWRQMLAKYNFNAIFFDYEDKFQPIRYFLTMRCKDPQWVMVYVDQYAVIFVRNTEQNREIIKKFRITIDNIGEKLAPLLLSADPEVWIHAADIFTMFRRWDLARPVFKKVLLARPDSGIIWLVAGETEVTTNNEESRILAAVYLEKAISLGQKNAEAYSFLGMAYIQAGDREKAKAALQKALKLDPTRQDATMFLNALYNNSEIRF
ncbi:MAG TPA: hypothetical protein DCL44_12050 [Elusimicrobia bacterium]|nr:hypothetical protein [Elusimicrobiota bacterium]